MHEGTVARWDDAKGWGFIRPDKGGDRDLFVHHTAIRQYGRRSLVVGERVQFDLGEREQGPCAENVIRLSSAA